MVVAMKIVVDIILVGIVLLGAYVGYKCGFVKITAKLLKLVFALFVAFKFAESFASAVVTPLISPSVTEYVSSAITERVGTITAANAADKLPTVLKISAAVFGIDINEIAASETGSLADRFAEELTLPCVNLVSVIISFIVLYILAKILLALIVFLFNSLVSRGPVGAINRVFGVVLSTAFFFVLAWGVAVAFDFVKALPALSKYPALGNFEGGAVYRFFNTYNPLELLLSF